MPSKSDLITTISGRFWRAGFLTDADNILTPAGSPQGRWHHSGQRAIYLSGTPEGCRVALNVYLKPDDPPRGIFPVAVTGAAIMDLRQSATRAALGTSLDEIHTFWATLHARGQQPPTWDVSDQIRAMGCDGLLTPSRSRPDLTHLTLFDWNEPGGVQLRQDGPSVSWDPKTPPFTEVG